MSEPDAPERRPHRSASGIEIEPVYGPADLADFDPATALGEPGSFPYTRGIHPDGYRGRPWTMRQYAGFGSAEETNRRFRYLLAHGTTGLSVAFDLPTQIGYDSDHPMAAGEVGRVGVAIDSIEDLRRLFEGIPLDRVTTSMTINATAATLLALYLVTAEEQGVAWDRVGGTLQNDILKEYAARGTYIYPPRPSLKLRPPDSAYPSEGASSDVVNTEGNRRSRTFLAGVTFGKSAGSWKGGHHAPNQKDRFSIGRVGDRGIDLQHFSHLCAGFGQAAEAHIGDRQEQVGITVFGLLQSIHRLSKSP